jgi:antitoxin (DNA-binding transcriptional repressor) of toxin-antitoxin stability system
VPQLPIRRLRAELATAVRRAEAGEVAVVTVGGRPVAQLGPVGASAGSAPTLADLVARGTVLAPRRLDRYRPGAPVPVWRATRLDRVLDDVR